jgi:hypothetical protein
MLEKHPVSVFIQGPLGSNCLVFGLFKLDFFAVKPFVNFVKVLNDSLLKGIIITFRRVLLKE